MLKSCKKEKKGKLEASMEQKIDSHDLKATDVLTMASTSASDNPSFPKCFKSRLTKRRDEWKFATCRLCDLRVVASTRYNLKNHVLRRHSIRQQYRCAYCMVEGGDTYRVRCHMYYKHDDAKGEAHLNPASGQVHTYQELINICFPNVIPYGRRKHTVEMSQVCSGCGEMVASERLELHLIQRHYDSCNMHSCPECKFTHADAWRVRLHITTMHADKADTLAVKRLRVRKDLDYTNFYNKFYFQHADRNDPDLTELLEEYLALQSGGSKSVLESKEENREEKDDAGTSVLDLIAESSASPKDLRQLLDEVKKEPLTEETSSSVSLQLLPRAAPLFASSSSATSIYNILDSLWGPTAEENPTKLQIKPVVKQQNSFPLKTDWRLKLRQNFMNGSSEANSDAAD